MSMGALSLPTLGSEFSIFLSMKISCGAHRFFGKPESYFMCESFGRVTSLSR